MKFLNNSSSFSIIPENSNKLKIISTLTSMSPLIKKLSSFRRIHFFSYEISNIYDHPSVILLKTFSNRSNKCYLANLSLFSAISD